MAKTTIPTIVLAPRDRPGTTGARALRHMGRIPAVIYGHGAPPLAVSVERRVIDDVVAAHRQSSLLDAQVDGNADTVVLRAIQRDPISRAVVHVDFQRVSRTETVEASLPVVVVGVAPGVRTEGGVLEVLTHTLDVSGPADRMPEQLEIDVSALGVHQHLTAKDVQLPPGFIMATPADTLVVTVEQPRVEVPVEAPELAPASTVAETPASTS